jgi:EAL domain-containing protein (putative c-di-GMP-specific phosphodiesterase class I)
LNEPTGGSGGEQRKDASRGRVLVVDDEAALLEIFSEWLGDAGFSVRTAHDGRHAAALLDAMSFDVVLTDIQMPDTNGLELLRKVRQHHLDLPVLLITANPTVETAVRALEDGALRYLTKPVTREALVAAIHQAVRLGQVAKLKRAALAHLGATEHLVGDRAGLEASFSRALQGLWMAYQPIVRASDYRVHAHEALVRTAESTLPSPGALFDAAERLLRVHDLGRAIRERVAATLRTAPTRLTFVNIHPHDLTDESLYSQASPLSAHARRVVLEVTERASLDTVPEVRSRIRDLRDMGYRVALDDLGAGYAGLTNFAALEPDVVKIDMALVRGIDAEPVKATLVESIVTACRDLGVTVVAEGVETEAERDTLVRLRCDLLQGYLFGRPAADGAAPVPDSGTG